MCQTDRVLEIILDVILQLLVLDKSNHTYQWERETEAQRRSGNIPKLSQHVSEAKWLGS